MTRGLAEPFNERKSRLTTHVVLHSLRHAMESKLTGGSSQALIDKETLNGNTGNT